MIETAPKAPVRLHRARVLSEWLDYNGHLNEAYYVLVFSRATDALMDVVGLDAASRARDRVSLYTLETHVRYLAEVREGEELVVDTRVTALDAKRAVLFNEMRRARDEALSATAEMLMLHVDVSNAPKAAPFGEATRAALEAHHLAQRSLDPPEGAGRAIALGRVR